MMKGRTPTKAEQEHMDKVRDLGCIICRQQGKGRRPCEIHLYTEEVAREKFDRYFKNKKIKITKIKKY